MATRDVRTPSILLVSHSADEHQVYARSLRASGYRVITAVTTALAYQIATTQPIDLVVTEACSPGSMSGVELTRRIRIHTRTMDVPIIVLTNGANPHDAALSMAAGANLFLERPVSGDVISEHATRLVGPRGTCPKCRGTLEYRHKVPVLSVRDPNARQPQDRLQYRAGWVCCNAACEHREWRTPADER